MKKIIAILVAAMLLVTSLLVAVPASAADSKTLNIDWTAYDYVAYGDSGYQVDESVVLENFTVTKTADTLKLEMKNFPAGSAIRAEYYLLDESHDMKLMREEIFTASNFAAYLELPLFTSYLVKFTEVTL